MFILSPGTTAQPRAHPAQTSCEKEGGEGRPGLGLFIRDGQGRRPQRPGKGEGREERRREGLLREVSKSNSQESHF